MNILEIERSKLELLQTRNLLLLPTSLVLEEQYAHSPSSPHKTFLSFSVAEVELRFLVTFSQPLDFCLLTPDILPLTSLELLPPSSSLLQLVRNLLQEMSAHQTSLLEHSLFSHIPSNLDHLQEVCPGVHHELVVQDQQATLLLKFPVLQDSKLVSLPSLSSSSRLLDTTSHHFILRLVFDLERGRFVTSEWKLQLSPDLAAMLPELQHLRLPGLGEESLPEFLMNSKERVEEEVVRAEKAWMARSQLMLPVLQAFTEEEGVQVTNWLINMKLLYCSCCRSS